MLFIGVPMIFVIALLVSVPVAYLMNRQAGGPLRSDVTKLVGAISLTLGFVLAIPGSGFASFWSLTYLMAAFTGSALAALVLAPASLCWWYLMRSSPTVGVR